MSRDTIRQHLKMLFQPGDTFEVRAPQALLRKGSDYRATASGYFTFETIDRAVEEIASIDDAKAAPGIYVTMNPVRADLLARAANRWEKKATATTADADILCRRWLVIDIDPKRPAKVSSTDAELKHAQDRAEQLRTSLASADWPEPAIALSGNGVHLIYRVDLPRDDEGLLKRVLVSIADWFDDDRCAIDRTMHNPARITKVIGTKARKGDHLHSIAGVEDRPHRRARFVHVPDELEVVPRESLERVAGAIQRHEVDAAARPPALDYLDGTVAGTRAWLEARGVAIKGEKATATGTLLLLEACPVTGTVSDGPSDIAVGVEDGGKLSYHNLHNRGQGLTWSDVRGVLDPEARSCDITGLLAHEATTTPAAADAPAGPAARLVNLEDVEPQVIEWLWPGRIAIGKLTMLAGDPGLGKSFVTLDIAARVSCGRPFPDAARHEVKPGGVVLISAEDDVEDTIRPRLDMLRANVRRINLLECIEQVDPETGTVHERGFTLSDLAQLEDAIDRTPDCRLVIIDPVSAHMGGSARSPIDSHKDADVRSVLRPLSALATRRRIAVLCVAHLNKGSARAIYRTMGSLAYVAAARSVLAVTKAEDDPSRRLMVPVKNNLGPDGDGLTYELAKDRPDDPSCVPFVRWDPTPVKITADEAMGSSKPEDDVRADQQEAVDWLRELLAGGPVKSTEVKAAAEANSISERNLRKAKKALGVIAKATAFSGYWTWQLPEPEADGEPAAQS